MSTIAPCWIAGDGCTPVSPTRKPRDGPGLSEALNASQHNTRVYHMNTFSQVSSLKLSALTDDVLRMKAPSIFAEHAHESRSERYTYIPTAEILAGMRREGFIPVNAIQSRSRIPGKAAFTKHQIRFNYEGADTRLLKVGDSVPQLVLTNSHDGTSTYQLDLGLFRLICLNGMMVADKQFSTFKVPHKGDILRNVIEGSYSVISQTEQLAERVEQFSQVRLTHQEQALFATEALRLRFDTPEGEQTPVTAEQALRPRRSQDAGDT